MTMVQATDGDTAAADNVHPFPSTAPEPPPRSRGRSKDRRAAARQAKRRSKIKADRDAKPDKDALVYAPPIAPTVTQSDVEDVTLPARNTAPSQQRAAEHHRFDRLTFLAARALATDSAGSPIRGCPD